MHGQEVGWEIELGDKFQFFFKQRFDLDAGPIGITAFQPFSCQTLQPCHGAFAIRNLIWVFIAQLAQLKTTAHGNFHRAPDCCRVMTKQPRHIDMAFQATFCIWERTGSDLVNCDMVAHTGQHIRQLLALTVVHQHIAHCDHRG